MNSETSVIIGNYPAKKTRIFLAVKLIIAATLMVYLFSYVQVDKILSTLQKSNYTLILISLILLIPNIFLQYLKWKLTCNQIIGEYNKRKIFISLLIGFPAAIITPARTGEYFGRGLAFKKTPFTNVVMATFVDKFFNLIVIFFIGSVCAIIFLNQYYNINFYLLITSFLLLLISLSAIGKIVYSKRSNLYNTLTGFIKNRYLQKLTEKLILLKNLNFNFIIKMSLISIAFFTCYLFQFVILIIAFSHHIDLLTYLFAVVLIIFFKSIVSPISFGELGIREGASVFFLTKLGESSSVALNSSLALFFINILIPALIGLLLLFQTKND